jgi:hypothetical protein
MMIISYRLGQKHYPIPYAWKKLTAYVVICVLLFGIHQLAIHWFTSLWFSHVFALLLLAAFGFLVLKIERKEFQSLPYFGKYI